MKTTVRHGRTTGANRCFAKKWVQCLINALCFVSGSLLADSFVAESSVLQINICGKKPT